MYYGSVLGLGWFWILSPPLLFLVPILDPLPVLFSLPFPPLLLLLFFVVAVVPPSSPSSLSFDTGSAGSAGSVDFGILNH